MGPAPIAGKAFFPLDEELGLLPGQLAPRQQEHLVHLASWMPFERAAKMLRDLLGVHVGTETARRLTERMGAWMDVAQAAEAGAPPSSASTEQPAPNRLVLSTDGAMISLVKQQWVEVRTMAIGEPVVERGPDGETEVHMGQLSYFSQLADASTFTRLATGEIRRRRVAEAQEVCAVTDGADWCQAFTETHRPDAVRILDFPHAAEHLSRILEAIEQAGGRLPEKLLHRCLHLLKRRGPALLLQVAHRWESQLSQYKGTDVHLEYLRKRAALMQYAQFRAHSWPIGSGMVESANKLVVQARLKGAGMHWERKNINPMLALRLAVCNERWQEMWRKACAHTRTKQLRPEEALPLASSSSSPSLAATSEAYSVSPSQRETRRRGTQTPGRAPRDGRAASPQSLGNREAAVCACGTPLQSFKGRRPKQYCSDRCRVRAYRARQAERPSGLSPAHQLKRQVVLGLVHQRVPHAAPFVKVNRDICPCGTPLTHIKGYRLKEYC